MTNTFYLLIPSALLQYLVYNCDDRIPASDVNK